MPVDPEISLHLADAPPAASANPMDTLSKFADIQNSLNQNRLFQQTFAARKLAGEIIASSPDMDTAMSALYKNPVTAPFASETANSIRQYQLSTLQMQGEQQHQAVDGQSALMQALPAIRNNPAQWDSILQGKLSLLSPVARERNADSFNSLRTSLLMRPDGTSMDDGKGDPAKDRQIFDKNMVGVMLGTGLTPDQVGTNVNFSAGNRQVFGKLNPVTGGLTEANSTPLGLPPTLYQGATGPGGAIAPSVISGSTATPVIGGNDLTGNPSPTPAGGNTLAPSQAAAAPSKIVGPSMETQDYLHKIGGNMADFEQDLNTTVSNLIPQMTRLKVEREALTGGPNNPGAAIGGWGENRAKLAQFLQGAKDSGVPVSQNWIDTVGNKSLSNSQVFKALSATQSAAMYQQAAEHTGRGFQLEYQAFKDAYPNLSTDPTATEKIYNFIQSTGEKYYTMQQDLLNFKHQLAGGKLPGYTISDFPAYEDKKMFESGKAFNQVNPYQHEAKSPQKVTHRWDPQKGLVAVPGGQ